MPIVNTCIYYMGSMGPLALQHNMLSFLHSGYSVYGSLHVTVDCHLT